MYYYVLFLSVTGIRPGEEALNIRWNDLEYIETEKDKRNYYRIHIKKGKKQGRPSNEEDEQQAVRRVLISEDAYNTIEQLKFLRTDTEDTDLMFSMPDGSKITRFSKMFRNCITACGLRISPAGENRALYSLRHSFASLKLSKQGVTYELLSWQMGTSVWMLELNYDHVVVDASSEELIL